MADISLRDLPDAFNRGEFTASETIAAGNVVAWNASTDSIELIAKTELTDPQNSTVLIRNPIYYNTVEGNEFGYCLASDENFLLVGAPFQNTADNEDEGVVYVYDAQTLSFITTLANPYVSAEGSNFGYSIAVCNGYAVVGARYDSERATRAGKILLYETTNWTLVNSIMNPNVRSNSSYDYFGTSVFVNDTYYGGGSVGEKASDLTAGAGAAWVYDLATHTGYFIDNPNIGTNETYDSFGFSSFLSCDSNHLLIGAYKEDDTATNQGAAYVFDLDSSTPTTPIYSIIGPNERGGSADEFGTATHINSSTFAVGAAGVLNTSGSNNSGAVYVYSTSTGSLLRTIYHPEDNGGDRFGTAVWQTDDYLYVGAARFDELGTSNVGAVYQFDSTGTLNYTFKASITHPEHLVTSLSFGQGLTATNDKLYVGACGYQSGSAADEGIVYTYDLTQTNADKWIGIAQENIVSGETGTVNLIGAVDKNQSSLTIGSEYYINSDGTLSRSNTVYGKIGLAISETDIVLYTNTDTSNLASISYVDAVKVSNLTELGIDDGTANQVLATDGNGVFSFVTLTGVTSTALAATDISITTNPESTASLSYDSSTSTFTYTPPDLSSYATTASLPTTSSQNNWDEAYSWGDHADENYIRLANLMITTTSAGGNPTLPSLTYDNTTGIFGFDTGSLPDTPEDVGLPSHPGLADMYLRSTLTGYIYGTLPESGIALTDLSIGPPIIGSSTAAPAAPNLSYDNTTGVFTFDQGNPTVALTQLGITDGTAGQILSTDGSGNFSFVDDAGGIALTDLSVTTATAGTAALAYDNTTGVFTYTPPDVSTGNIEVGVGTDSNFIQTTSGSGFDLLLAADSGFLQLVDDTTVDGTLTVMQSITAFNNSQINAMLTVTGQSTLSDIIPDSDNAKDLGSSSVAWKDFYIKGKINGEYSLPDTDGTEGQVLKTDGSGAVTFQPLGGGGVANFVATGTIANGDIVGLRSDGTIEKIAETLISLGTNSVGSNVTFESGTVDTYSAVYNVTENKVVIIYRKSGNGFGLVGEVSGDSITFGSPVQFTPGFTESADMEYDPVNNKVLIAFEEANNGLAAVVGTVSGNSISFGSVLSISSESSGRARRVVYDPSSGNFVILYTETDGATTNVAKAVVATISGTSVTVGTVVTYNSASTLNTSAIVDTTANKIVALVVDGTSKIVIGTVSGNSISFAAPVTWKSSNVFARMVFDPSSDKVILAYGDGDNNDYGTAVVGTVSGDNITFGSDNVYYTDGPSYYNAMTYDSNVNKIVIMLQDGNSEVGYIVSGSVSGDSIAFSSPTQFWPGTPDRDVITFDSTNNKVVLAWQDYGNADDGMAAVATIGEDVISTNAGSWIGIANETITDGATGEISIISGTAASLTGLTAGSTYYVNYDGTLTATEKDGPIAGTYGIIGRALSDTELLIVESVNGLDAPSIPSDISDLTDTGGLLSSGATTLDELTDVTAAGATNGQVLTADGAGAFSFTTVASGGINFVSITDITTSNQTDLIYAGLTVADDASFVATKLMVYYNGSLLVPGTSTPTYDFFIDSGTIGAESNGWRINLNFTPLDGSTIVVYRLS